MQPFFINFTEVNKKMIIKLDAANAQKQGGMWGGLASGLGSLGGCRGFFVWSNEMFDKNVLDNQQKNISPAQFQAPSQVGPENYSTSAGIQNVMQNLNPEPGGWWQKATGFLGTPLGRALGTGLLTGGVVAASGGDGLEALSYGAQSAGRASDIYRRELARQARRDLEEQYFQSKLRQQQAEQENRQQERAEKARRDKELEDYRYQNEINKLLLQSQLGKEAQEKALVQNNSEDEAQLGAIEQQLKNFENTFNAMPSKLNAFTTGALRTATGFETPEMANFDAQRTLLFNKIARDLGGEKGPLSDGDIKRVSAALPTMYDSLEQKKAKMQAVYGLLDLARQKAPGQQSGISAADSLQSVGNGNDPLGIR